LTFIGPVKLIQNGKFAVIARHPVFKGNDQKGQFWGFTIALIYIEQIIPDELKRLPEIGIQYQLNGSDPDSNEDIVFARSPLFEPHEENIVAPIKVPNGIWSLHLHRNKMENKWYLPLRITCVTISVFLAFFIGIQQIRTRRQAIQIIRLNKNLEKLSYQDELTLLGNRRSVMNILSNLVPQVQRYNEPLSVCLMDVDLFKNVNDSFGHPAGDECLRHVATIFKSIVRQSDILARLGGDEFMCIFPRTNINSALVIVKKMRLCLDTSPFKYKNHDISLSLSYGITEIRGDQSMDQLITAADTQLYQAKKVGRNKISIEADIF